MGLRSPPAHGQLARYAPRRALDVTHRPSWSNHVRHPLPSPKRQQAMRLSGTVAGLGLGGFAVIWLFADRASSKLAVILWGAACVTGLWLAAIS